jgi:hypothetical protein
LVAIWRRGGDTDTCLFPLPEAATWSGLDLVYPAGTDATFELVDSEGGPALRVTLPQSHQALVLAVEAPR